jgi:hypothetical protein
MRKIEEKIIAAINAEKTCTIGNTKVFTAGGIISVYLHGHMIAQRRGHVGGQWEISLAGWNTRTTRSRLSAIIRAAMPIISTGKGFRELSGDEISQRYPQGLGVSTCKGKVRLHDARGITAIDSTGWHKVEN